LTLFWKILPWLLTAVGGIAWAVIWRRHRRLLVDQRRSECALASAGLTLTRIRQAVESASDAIGIGDFEGNSFYHNQAHIRLFGYAVEELNAIPGEGVLFADKGVAREILASIRAGRSWAGETDGVA